MREYRFALGSAGGRRSSVWKLWTSGDHAYLQSRMMGTSTKVSIHSDGQAHWSMQEEWYGLNKPHQPNRNRHISRWKWQAPEPNVARHVFRLSFPDSELRDVSVTEDLAGVQWLPLPGKGRKTTVECYVSPTPAEQAPIHRLDFLAGLELTRGQSLVALVSNADVSDSDSAILLNGRLAAARRAAASGYEIQPVFRGVVLFAEDSGVRGIVEFVPAAV